MAECTKKSQKQNNIRKAAPYGQQEMTISASRCNTKIKTNTIKHLCIINTVLLILHHSLTLYWFHFLTGTHGHGAVLAVMVDVHSCHSWS